MADLSDLKHKGSPCHSKGMERESRPSEHERPTLTKCDLGKNDTPLRETQRHIQRTQSQMQHATQLEPGSKAGTDTNIKTAVEPSHQRATQETRIPAKNERPQPEATSQTAHREESFTQGHAATIARDLYQAMKGGLTGIGTDEKAILSTLMKMKPGEFAQVLESYRAQFGRDLKHDLISELKDNRRFIETLKILEAGEPIASRLAILKLETELPATDSAMLKAVLRDCTPSEMTELMKRFRESSGREFLEVCREKLPLSQCNEIAAILSGDPVRVDVVLLQRELDRRFGVSAERILKIIGDIEPSDRLQKLEAYYRDLCGKDLRTELERVIRGADKHIITSLFDGRTAETYKHLVEKTLRIGDSYVPKLVDVVQRGERTVSEILKSLVELRPGVTLEKILSENKSLSQPMKTIVLELVAHGKVSDEAQLYLALIKKNNVQPEIQKVIGQRTPDQIVALLTTFSTKFGTTVEPLIQSNLQRTDRFDTRLAFLGRPETNVARYWDLWALHRHERERQSPVIKKVIDSVTSHGNQFDERVSELTTLYRKREKQIDFLEEKGGPFSRLLSFGEGDLKTLRHATASFQSLIALILAVIATGLTIFILSQLGLPLWQSLLGGLGSGYVCRSLVSRRLRYGGNDSLDVIEDLRFRRRHLPSRLRNRRTGAYPRGRPTSPTRPKRRMR